MIPVLSSIEAEDLSDEGRAAGFITLAHTHVLDLTQRLVTQNRSRIPSDAMVLLDQDIELLKRLTMQDDELAQLCKAIYRRHREAIDLIVRHGSSSQVLDACQAAIGAFARRPSTRAS